MERVRAAFTSLNAENAQLRCGCGRVWDRQLSSVRSSLLCRSPPLAPFASASLLFSRKKLLTSVRVRGAGAESAADPTDPADEGGKRWWWADRMVRMRSERTYRCAF